MCACVYVCVFVFMYVHVCVCDRMYVCLCMSVSVCACPCPCVRVRVCVSVIPGCTLRLRLGVRNLLMPAPLIPPLPQAFLGGIVPLHWGRAQVDWGVRWGEVFGNTGPRQCHGTAAENFEALGR